MTNPMELPTRTDLSKLVRYSGGLAISLYMPTHRAGVETLQGPIRLKNLLREAMESLQAAGRRGSEIEELLQPVRRLLEDYDFWQHQSDGLAIFRAADLLQLYRVPQQVPELAVVAEGFHLKPLLACITGNRHFYVLALSQNHARIFRATQEGITELEMKGMPTNLAEVLRDRYAGSQLQAHSASSAPASQHGAVFHGQGGGDEEKKERLGIYFRRIDRGIQDLLASDRGPVILAAIDSLVSLYRKTNSTPELLDQWVSGNPDELAPQELLDRAAPIASAYFLQAQQQARDQYLTLQHTQRASNLLSAVLPAAIHGRVACLFVAIGVQIWGHHDLSANEIRIVENPGAGDQDLLNLAAIHAYINGGTVYAVPAEEVPGSAPLAAVLRY